MKFNNNKAIEQCYKDFFFVNLELLYKWSLYATKVYKCIENIDEANKAQKISYLFCDFLKKCFLIFVIILHFSSKEIHLIN